MACLKNRRTTSAIKQGTQTPRALYWGGGGGLDSLTFNVANIACVHCGYPGPVKHPQRIFWSEKFWWRITGGGAERYWRMNLGGAGTHGRVEREGLFTGPVRGTCHASRVLHQIFYHESCYPALLLIFYSTKALHQNIIGARSHIADT